MNRLSRTLVPLLALVTLVAIVFGIPVLLIVLVGWPVPSPMPTSAELGDVFAGRAPIPADYLISVFAIVMWLLWIQILWATLIETGAAFRGRLASRARMVPGVQMGVAKLVTTATLLATSFAVRPASAGPLVPVASVQPMTNGSSAAPRQAYAVRQHQEQPAPAPAPATATAHLTETGDTWWGIAEQHFGSGTRWKEIRAVNLGRTMADGTVISTGTDMLKPQWRLLLPSRPTVSSTTGSGVARSVVVERGDTIWGIAEQDLSEAPAEPDRVGDERSEPSVGEVAEHVSQIADLNRSRLDGNPDLIHPGQQLDLPPQPMVVDKPAAGSESAVAAAPATTSSTAAPTTAAPTTAAPTTTAPTTAAPTTTAPTTAASTTAAPAASMVAPVRPSQSTAPTVASTATAPTSSSTAPASSVAASSATASPRTTRANGQAVWPTLATRPPPPPTSRPGAARAAPPTTVSTESSAGTGAAEGSGNNNSSDNDNNDNDNNSDNNSDNNDNENGTEGGTGPTETSAASVGRSLAGAVAVAEGVSVPTTSAVDGPGSDSPSLTGEFRNDSAGVAERPDDGGDADSVATSALGPLSADDPSELRTGVELRESELVAGQSPGEAEDLDSQSSRAPVFVGLAALTLLGGYLHRARGRRRQTAMRNRHPGRRPAEPKRRTRAVARRLSAAAEAGHPEFVNIGLRALSRQLQDVSPEQLPIISGIWVSHNRLVIALADDSPRITPPEPFVEFADGSGWSLHRSKLDLAAKYARGANGPLPLLTTVGTTTALDLALTTNSRAPAEAYGLASSLLFAIDLEAGRVISVQANDDVSTIEALTMMALELATSETADQAEVVCVGFGHRLATFDRVMVVDDVSEILADLEDVTGRAVYAAADASPFATRVGNGAADTWNPVIVFHADGYDPHSRTLIELAERTPGGVTAVCGYPTGSGWTLRLDGDKISCPDLPGDLGHHQFKRPELDGVELIPDLFDEPWDDVPLDDDFWQPMDPVEAAHTWHLLDSDETSWRPMQSVTAPEKRTRPASNDHDKTMAVVVNQPDVEPEPDPEDLWDRFVSFDPEGWPDTDIPALDQLRHSVEHRPDEHPLDAEVDRLIFDGKGRPQVDDGGRGRHLYVVDDDTDDVDDPLSAEHPLSAEPPVPAAGRPLDPGAPEPGPVAGVGADRGDVAEAPVDPEPEPVDPEPEPGAGGDGFVVPMEPTDLMEPVDTAEPNADDATDPGGMVGVSVLGNFTIEGHHVGDRTKPWKYTKTPELILYLLLHPGGASQDLLMEQLFPEQPPNRPRLNQLVSDARTKALGQNADGDYHLPHASPTEPFYKLLPSVGLDLRDFAQHCANAKGAENVLEAKREWEAALRLVRGRPFTVPHDGYEWALAEIEATIIKVEEAAVALADIAFEFEDYQLAVWATKKGLLTGTGYYELLVKRGRAALLLQDPEEIVRAFADLQVSLEYSGAPEEGVLDLTLHPDLEEVYNELSSEGRSKDRPS